MPPLPSPPVSRYTVPNRDRVTSLVIILALSASACQEEKAPTAPAATEALSVAAAPAADDNVAAMGTIPLPINQTFNGGLAFGITQSGTGRVGLFKIENPSNTSVALDAYTEGRGSAFRAISNGSGRAGEFIISKTTSGAAALDARTSGISPAGIFRLDNTTTLNSALVAIHTGRGAALEARSMGGPAARFMATGSARGIDVISQGSGPVGLFMISNSNNIQPALEASTNGTGRAAFFHSSNAQSLSHAVEINYAGRGSAIRAFSTGSGSAGEFRNSGTGAGVVISTNGGPGLSVSGGSKNAIVPTTTGGRALYTEESSEVWFSDYGFGRTEHGRVRVLIDPTFAQTINTNEPYHVFLEEYGNAQLYVSERTPLGFVVQNHGGPDVEFSYRLVAKRQGFETQRLERAPWADNSPGFETLDWQ